MKLLTFSTGAHESFGAAVEGGIVDLGDRLGARLPSLHAVLEAGALDEVRRVTEGASPDLALEGIRYLRPIPRPEKILCVGVNFPERHAEYRDASAVPQYPSIFMRTPGSLVAHLEPIVRPGESAELDYEGEVAIIVGLGGRRIPEADAERHIAGVTCVNDGTLRDWVRHGKFNVTPGKNFERSGAIGPWMVTLDEAGPLDGLTITTVVNGEQRQHDSTGRMLFPIRRLLAYVSTFCALAPGDVIVTGTPPGAGARLDPPRFLQAGDRVEVTVSRVGTLANTVVDESA